MSKVLLDVVGPSASNLIEATLTYPGFKHVSVQGNFSANYVQTRMDFLAADDGLAMPASIGETYYGTWSGYQGSIWWSEWIDLDTDSSSDSNLYTTFFNLTIFDLFEPTAYSSATMEYFSSPVDQVGPNGTGLFYHSLFWQFLETGAIEKIRLRLLGAGQTFNADSELKVFGHRG